MKTKISNFLFIIVFVTVGVMAHRYCLHKIKDTLDIVSPSWYQQVK